MTFSNRALFILLVTWLLQFTVAPHLAIADVVPDLILIVIASYAFLEGPAPGSVAGFAGGLLADLSAGQSVGLSALAHTVVGYLSGLVERTVFGSSSLLPTVAMFVVATMSQLLYIGASFLVGEQIEVLAALRSTVLPSSAYTAAVTFVVFPHLSRFLSVGREAKVFK